MIKKTIIEQKKENTLFIILFLISLILSNLGIPGIQDPAIMPNYFLALIVTFILTKRGDLNLYKLVIIGLIVDLFVGQLLGQYGLIFISIYLLAFIINKILIINSEKQLIGLSVFLILFSFFILWASSKSHDIFISFNLLLLQSILTFFAYLIFRAIINRFISK